MITGHIKELGVHRTVKVSHVERSSGHIASDASLSKGSFWIWRHQDYIYGTPAQGGIAWIPGRLSTYYQNRQTVTKILSGVTFWQYFDNILIIPRGPSGIHQNRHFDNFLIIFRGPSGIHQNQYFDNILIMFRKFGKSRLYPGAPFVKPEEWSCEVHKIRKICISLCCHMCQCPENLKPFSTNERTANSSDLDLRLKDPSKDIGWWRKSGRCWKSRQLEVWIS